MAVRQPPPSSGDPDGARRVLLVGFGSVGRHVARLLQPERDAGLIHLSAVVRDVAAHRERGDLGVRLLPLADAEGPGGGLPAADLVVECAGIIAAHRYGQMAVARGTDLVLTSVGALARTSEAAPLLAGPGRLHVTNGAIGGFDVLGAAADAGGLEDVRIRTSKLPASLVRPWMGEVKTDLLEALRPGDVPVTVFTGDPAEAVELFPANVNVAVALAWATRGRPQALGDDDAALLARSLRRVHVELVADPKAVLTRHEITAAGAAGEIRVSVASAPSPENPRTSGMTALSVAHTVRAALGL